VELRAASTPVVSTCERTTDLLAQLVLIDAVALGGELNRLGARDIGPLAPDAVKISGCEVEGLACPHHGISGLSATLPLRAAYDDELVITHMRESEPRVLPSAGMVEQPIEVWQFRRPSRERSPVLLVKLCIYGLLLGHLLRLICKKWPRIDSPSQWSAHY
jgi:hypothetical protein